MIVPRYTREIPQRFRLEGAECTGCGKISFPPRRICPSCSGQDFRPRTLAREGTILSYTIVHVAAESFELQTPFAVGIIETPEKVRLTAQIVDCDFSELSIGKKVRLVLRKIQKEGHAGILQYGYKAVLER